MRIPGWTKLTIEFTHTKHVLSILLAFLMVASAAVAGVLVNYNTASTTSYSLRAPPVVWVDGPDDDNNFAGALSIGSNATYFTLTLKPVPEANVTWQNLTTLQHSGADSASYTVFVNGTSLSSGYAKILDFRLEFIPYGSSTATYALNLKDASPTTGGITFAPGSAYAVKAYMKLDTGTSASDLPSEATISLSISPN